MKINELKRKIKKEFQEFKRVKVEFVMNNGELIKTYILDPNKEEDFKKLHFINTYKDNTKDGYVIFRESLTVLDKNKKEIFEEDIIEYNGKNYIAISKEGKNKIKVINVLYHSGDKKESIIISSNLCKTKEEV